MADAALAASAGNPDPPFTTDQPGLLLGLAGLGSFYLRLANPTIPSPLAPSSAALASLPHA